MISPRGFADSTSADRTEAHLSQDASASGSPDSSSALSSLSSAAGRPDETHFEVPDLIPVRMLNEFAYCPRLCYLEWVQGEWADNLETHQGTFGHRVVDHPSRGAVPAGQLLVESQPSSADGDAANSRTNSETDADPAQGKSSRKLEPPSSDVDSEPIHARSLMLSAPGEGLIAKLDLLELDGNEATPVDYKRGRVPDVPDGAYEPERVQLCAQGLILRENGFQSHQGVLYFIESRRRVVIPFDEVLVERTRELAKQMRFTADEGVIPEPLEDSPKCPRCSLVGICMPDEVNWLRQRPERRVQLSERPTD